MNLRLRDRPSPLLFLFLLPLLIFSTACGAGAGSGGMAPWTTGASSTDAERSREPAEVRVFAAASLAEVFTDVEEAFAEAHPEHELVFNFAGSNTLALQLLAGARAELVASADDLSLEPLLREGLIEAPVDFARNRLVLAVPAGNPAGIRRIDDLPNPGVRLALAGPEVPAGRYGREFLRLNGAAAALDRPLSDEPDVRAVVARLLLGEADAGIVYASDLAAMGDRLMSVPIDDEVEVVARYPLALLRSARNAAGARALVDFLRGEEGARLLQARGFLRP